RVGISAPPCLRRMRALEEAGYIKGYRALLDEKLLGYEVAVFAMVHLTSQADSDLKAFEDFVRAEPLVRECWMLSGEIDFVLKCVAPNLSTFQDFVARLTAEPHVRNVKTSLTLRNAKGAGEWGGDGDALLLGVGLRLADDLPHLLLVGILVDHGDGRAERDGFAGQFRDVDHLGARELVLELGDAALVVRLFLLGGVILRVLGQIAVRAGIGDLLDDAGPFHLLALLQLGLERRVALGRHRELFHRSFVLRPVMRLKLFPGWSGPHLRAFQSVRRRLRRTAI